MPRRKKLSQAIKDRKKRQLYLKAKKHGANLTVKEKNLKMSCEEPSEIELNYKIKLCH